MGQNQSFRFHIFQNIHNHGDRTVDSVRGIYFSLFHFSAEAMIRQSANRFPDVFPDRIDDIRTRRRPADTDYISLYTRNRIPFLSYTVIEVTALNQLKSYTITGILFVLILGTLSHFFYEWSNHNFIVGFFMPVSESIWEHMKLIFFPMLLYSIVMIPKLNHTFPCVCSAYFSGLLTGTLLIPVIFYTYTGILGYNLLILDIATFVLCVLTAFYTARHLTLTCRMQRHTVLLSSVVFLTAICFIVFSYCPPGLALFQSAA